MTNVKMTTPPLSTQLERYGFTEREIYVDYPMWEAKKVWENFRKANGLAGAPRLLTHPEDQFKLGKSEAYTVGLTLQSADGSGVETCPWRGQCAEVCVLKNGNGAYPKVQTARNVKTQFLQQEPGFFLRLLLHEFDLLSRMQAEEYDRTDEWFPLRARMNVNSDLRWYRIVPWFFEKYSNIQFYDYTKNPAILSDENGGEMASNYLLVPSIGEKTNMVRAYEFLSHGGKVAVVTNRKKGAPVDQEAVIDHLFGHIDRPFTPIVVDGDKTDDLWSHPWEAVIDLTAKGRARKMPEGFVRHAYSN